MVRRAVSNLHAIIRLSFTHQRLCFGKMSSSNFDSQATTPTRASFDQQAQYVPPVPQNARGRLDTIPSVLYTDEDQNNSNDSAPSTSREEADIEAGPVLKKEVSEKAPQTDPNLVVWTGPDDPENPQNFSAPFKWTITMLLSSLTIWITFATSVFSTATVVTAEVYGVSTEVTTLATSLPLFVSFLFTRTVEQQNLTWSSLGICHRSTGLGPSVRIVWPQEASLFRLPGLCHFPNPRCRRTESGNNPSFSILHRIFWLRSLGRHWGHPGRHLEPSRPRRCRCLFLRGYLWRSHVRSHHVSV